MVDLNFVKDLFTIVGAALGAITFYFTFVHPPRVRLVVAPRIRVHYTPGGGVGWYIPVSFVNRIQKTGLVYYLALVFKAGEDDCFGIECSRLSELSAEKKLVDVELPYGIAVPGRSSVGKVARFQWWDSSQPRFKFDERPVELTVHAWTSPSGRPLLKSPHTFRLTANELTQLDAGSVSSRTIEVTLDAQPPSNWNATRNAVERFLNRNPRA